jgi:phytoene desaturase
MDRTPFEVIQQTKMGCFCFIDSEYNNSKNGMGKSQKETGTPARTAVVGAGIAGIAVAIRMAAKGDKVTVFEANAYPGGKLSSFDMGDYRFDAGPSLFTMPGYVEELFALAGERASDHFEYQRMDRTCHYFWNDGTALTAWADPMDFAREASEKLGVSAPAVRGFLKRSALKYRYAGHLFLEKSLHRVSTWLSWPVFWALWRFPKFELFASMHQVHRRWFGHGKLVQLFDRYATYNGSNPYKASGMLTIIPHFEHNMGVFYPRGGMHTITDALYKLSLRLGVTYLFESPVTKIQVDGSRVSGLISQGMFWSFDRVISNMDIFYTYRRLMPNFPAPEAILSQPKSSSALIFYWGISRNFPQLDLHNIFFSDDYRSEFEAIESGRVVEDPTIYINITSKYTPEDAPGGCENWFVMLNVPCDVGQDWSVLIPELRRRTLEKLNRLLGTDLASVLECEQVLDPRGIEARTSSHRGALYGYSSNTLMAAFLRHPNFSRRVNNLYFVGGSVHPGGGIPLCLLSARIASEQIENG